MDTPKLTIRVHDGMAIFTDVKLDGKRLPVTRVSFDIGKDEHDGFVLTTLTILADIDLEMDGAPLAVAALRASDNPRLVEVDMSTLTEEMSLARPVVRPTAPVA